VIAIYIVTKNMTVEQHTEGSNRLREAPQPALQLLNQARARAAAPQMHPKAGHLTDPELTLPTQKGMFSRALLKWS
jgi:hypothetical protein